MTAERRLWRKASTEAFDASDAWGRVGELFWGFLDSVRTSSKDCASEVLRVFGGKKLSYLTEFDGVRRGWARGGPLNSYRRGA